MNKLRKALIISISVMTVFSMSMVAVPFQVSAASAGDLIKIDGYAPVYYLGSDDKRYVFPNESTYFSWYTDFSTVVTLGQDEVEGYPLAANVVVRPGTKLVKRPVQTDPKVYAVEPGGVLRHITDEATAVGLYGDAWAQRVVDVADSFFVNYTVGADAVADVYPAGSLVKYEGAADVFYINEDGEAQKVADEAAFNANGFSWDDVINAPATMAMPTAGDDIDGAGVMLDTAQGGASTGTVVNPDAGSGLSVALSSATMASASLPAGAAGGTAGLGGAALVPFTTVNFTASNDGDVTIDGLTVTRIGIGNDNELGNVYIYDGATRLTNGRSVSSDDTTVFNLDFVVAAGTTETLTIRANIAENGSAGSHGFAVTLGSDVETDGAAVTGSFPIEGNLMSLTGVDAAGITYRMYDGADLDDSLKVGEDVVELAELKLTETNGDENALVEMIVFTQKGSIDSTDLDNIFLTNGGDVVADDISVDGDRITVTFDTPFVIEDGDSETFELVMDVTAGTGETMQFEIDDAEDVVVRGASYGYYTMTAVDTASETSSITVESGDLTVTEADENPTTQNVAVGQDDVTFLAAKFEAADEPITVTNVDVVVTFAQAGAIDNDSTEDFLTNLSLYLDGSRVGGPDDIDLDTTDTTVTVSFDDEFEVTGEQILTVVADVSDDADSGNYSMEIDSGAITAEDASGDDIATAEITGVASGNLVKVALDNPAVVKDSTLGNKTIVAGDTDFEVARFILDAGESEAIDINQYTVSLAFTGSLVIADIQDLYINEESPVSSPAASQDFSVNSTVLAGGEQIISVFLTIDSDTTATSGATVITTLSVDAEGDVSGDDVTEDGFAGAASVTTVTGQTSTIAAGALTLALSSGTPDEGLIVAGAANVFVGEFEFAAANTGYEITEMTVTARVGAATSSAATATNISSMTIDGTSDSTNAGVAEVTTLIRVEKDDETKVAVYATFNDDFDAITSADEVYFHVSGYKYIADNDTSTEEEVVHEAGTYIDVITTEKLAVYNTIPTIVASAGDTTTLKTSDNEIMDISVTADASDDVTVETVAVEVRLTDAASSDLGTSTVELLDGNGDVVATGVHTVVSTVDTYTFTMTTDNVVAAGSTEVFTVNVNLANVNVDDSAEVSLIETGFTWSDDEGTGLGDADLINDLDGSFEISK